MQVKSSNQHFFFCSFEHSSRAVELKLMLSVLSHECIVWVVATSEDEFSVLYRSSLSPRSTVERSIKMAADTVMFGRERLSMHIFILQNNWMWEGKTMVERFTLSLLALGKFIFKLSRAPHHHRVASNLWQKEIFCFLDFMHKLRCSPPLYLITCWRMWTRWNEKKAEENSHFCSGKCDESSNEMKGWVRSFISEQTGRKKCTSLSCSVKQSSCTNCTALNTQWRAVQCRMKFAVHLQFSFASPMGRIHQNRDVHYDDIYGLGSVRGWEKKVHNYTAWKNWNMWILSALVFHWGKMMEKTRNLRTKF